MRGRGIQAEKQIIKLLLRGIFRSFCPASSILFPTQNCPGPLDIEAMRAHKSGIQ